MPFGKLEKFDNSIDKELSILFIQETKLFRKDFTLFIRDWKPPFCETVRLRVQKIKKSCLLIGSFEFVKKGGCLTTFVESKTRGFIFCIGKKSAAKLFYSTAFAAGQRLWIFKVFKVSSRLGLISRLQF